MIKQLLNINDQPQFNPDKPLCMIDNYLYLYHTKKLIILPLYPESIQDSMPANFQPNTPMLRSAPIYSYSDSGPRSLQIELPLHRDMLNDVNIESSRFGTISPELFEEDYVDIMINQLQAAALPKYATAQKMVDPPIVAVRFGNSIFCKGVVKGGVTVSYSGPILENNKYAVATVGFTVEEIDPYDADTVMIEGGFRGIRKTLESNLFKTK